MAHFLWQEIFLCSLPPPSPLAGCAALDVFRAEGRRVEGMAKKRGFTKKNGGTYTISTEAVSFKLILGGSMSVFMDIAV